MNPKNYIIIVNYNGWRDTIECIESIFKINYPNYQIIVVDNNSSGNDLRYLMSWLKGELEITISSHTQLHHLCTPPQKKPIPFFYYSAEEIELGKNILSEINSIGYKQSNYSSYPVILIETKKNLGFAYGNNVGIKYVLRKDDFEYVWFLNNDTVVENNSLDELVKKAEEYNKSGTKIGIIGAKLMYYDEPDKLQGVGGKYNRFFGTIKHIGESQIDWGKYDTDIKFDYVLGASMHVKKQFLLDVGFMCEEYFLYFEELDWIERGKKQGWDIGYCWKIKVYHKAGKSAGSNITNNQIGKLIDYYQLKNRIIFTKKFYPLCLITVYIGFIFVLFNRMRRRQIDRAKMIIDILLGRKNHKMYNIQ